MKIHLSKSVVRALVNVARGAREPKRERVALGERKKAKGDLSEKANTHTHKTSLNDLGPMPWANYLAELHCPI